MIRRHVRYQALWQIAHFGTRIGDDLLTLGRHTAPAPLRVFCWLTSRKREAAELLQRRQIMQLGWDLPAYPQTRTAKRAPSKPRAVLATASAILALNNSGPAARAASGNCPTPQPSRWRQFQNKQAARKLANFQLALLHTMANVRAVFTRPTPITLRARLVPE